MAVQVYRRVLATPVTDADINVAPVGVFDPVACESGHEERVQPNEHTTVCCDVRREAAWNLACILRQSGQHALAQQLCAQFLCID